MDTSKIREDWKQGRSVDVGQLLDTIDRLTQALAGASEKLDEAVKKIDGLTKFKRLDQPGARHDCSWIIGKKMGAGK